MRRLVRILLNAATAVSLVLCAGALALWVRGYWAGETLEYHRVVYRADATASWGGIATSRHVSFESGRGGLGASYWSFRRDEPRGVSRESGGWESSASPNPEGLSGVLGRIKAEFGYGWWSKSDPPPDPTGWSYHCALLIPCWLAVAVTGIGPAFRLWRFRQRSQRSADGRCPACGYDLRATPDRCPECGTIPAR